MQVHFQLCDLRQMLTKMLRDDVTLPKLAALGLAEGLDALYNKTQKMKK